MMRLMVRIGALVTLCGVLVAASRGGALGRTNDLMAIFRGPQAQPCRTTCLFGVVPGQSTRAEALEAFDTHPLTRGLMREVGLTDNAITYWGAEFEVRFTFTPDTAIVTSVLLLNVNIGSTLSPIPTRLADALSILNAPTSVFVRETPLVPLAYPRERIVVFVLPVITATERMRLTLNDTVYMLGLYDADMFAKDMVVHQDQVTGWLGLTRFSRYRTP